LRQILLDPAALEDLRFRQDRDTVRELLSQDDFIEIYCNASLEVCESRDVKGLYKRARAGEIKKYTGIDSPYEEPRNPELTVNTGDESLEESVIKVIKYLKQRMLLNNNA